MAVMRTLFIADYFCGTCQGALAALDAVGVEIATGLATGLVGGELHGTDSGAHLALHAAGVVDMHGGETLREGLAVGSYP